MIKTIISLFAIYESSLANRLILQAPPQFPWEQPPVAIQPVVITPPVQQPPAPQVPWEPIPIQPQPQPQPQPPVFVPIPAPVDPIQPVVVAPVIEPPVIEPPVIELPVVNPAPIAVPPPIAVPQPIAVPPIAVPPIVEPQAPVNPIPAVPVPPIVIPQPPVIQVNPNPFPWQTGNPPAMAHKLECKIEPPTTGGCAQSIHSITNPSSNYEVLCSGRGSCFGSTINIDLTPMGLPIERLKGFWFTMDYAGMNARININNQRPTQIRIDEIKCDKPMSCQNTAFIFGPGIYIEAGDFYCNTYNACDGCTINGVPCVYYVEPI